MSKRNPAPDEPGSRGPRNTSNQGSTNSGSARNTGQNGASQRTSGGSSAQRKESSAQNSANYRARRAAAMRSTQSARKTAEARTGAPHVQGRAQQVPWWRRGNLPIFATVAVVVAIVIVFIAIGHGQGGSSGGSTGSSADGALTSAAVVNEVTHVSTSVIDKVGAGGTSDSMQVAKGAQPLTGSDGKPQIVYIGADYCPFCAAERWSLIVALSRFGSFSNLHNMSSNSGDTDPNTPTFSFYGSSYTSTYVDFTPVETVKQDETTPLQTPTAQQQQLLNTYDVPPYVSQQGNPIPFIDLGGTLLQDGAGYNPQLLAGWTREQIAAKLSNPNDSITKSIVGQANYLTAAICKATKNQPAQVCSDHVIQSLEQQLPKGS